MKAWAARWKLVNEREIEELRATPMETKLEQLALLMDAAHDFGWDATDAAEVDAVRARWVRLHRTLGRGARPSR